MIEELKARARAGDLRALQELRDRGFFGAPKPRRTYELSAAQRRMWVVAQETKAGAAYNMPRALRLDGRLDVTALEQAFTTLVARHESLRTTFDIVDDEPRQVIHPPAAFALAMDDLRGRAAPMDEAVRLAREESRTGFDLRTGPLFRVRLLRTGDEQHVLVFNVHHIVCDAWSLDVIVRDVAAACRNAALEPLRIQYKDFARWHNTRLLSAEAAASRGYWIRRLTPLPPPLDLPSDRPRPAEGSWRGETVVLDLGPAIRDAVYRLAARERTSIFTVLLAAAKALLHLESGEEDIVVGSPVAGRDNADLEPQVGMFANAVAVRARVDAGVSFQSLLHRVRAAVEEAFEHQETPFDEVVSALGLAPDPSRTPLFDVLVGLLNTERGELRLDELTIAELDVSTGLAPHDLVFYFAESGGSLHVSALYRAELFDRSSIQRLAARLARLLNRALAAPGTPLGDLDPSPALTAPGREAELATRIAAMPDVVDAAVVTDAAGAPVICVVPREPHAGGAVRARIARLAAHRVVIASTFPLLPDGTLHVRRLERLVADRDAGRERPVRRALHVWDLVPPDATASARTSVTVANVSEPVNESFEGLPLALSHGAQLRADDRGWTLGEVLTRAATCTADDRLTFLDAAGAAGSRSYADLLGEAQRVLGGLRAHGISAGDRVVLLLSEARDVLPAFWGCVLAGATPLISAVPPEFGSGNRAVEQFAHIWRVLERPLVVVTRRLKDAVLSLTSVVDVTADRVCAVEDLRAAEAAGDVHQAAPDDLAFFSLTSGSTGAPKCVMLTHRNVLSRARGTSQLCGDRDTDVALNWLPFDHIGSLSDWHVRCVDLACRAIYAPKEFVLGEPLRWLELLDRHRATHSWAPNFAYALVTDALAADNGTYTWDLSRVRTLLTAGEAVTPAAVDAFNARLARYGLKPDAVKPAFGMAEMASGVTYGATARDGESMSFHRIDRTSLSGTLRPVEAAAAAAYADLGPPIPGVSLRIVADDGSVVTERRIGRLQVKGAAVAQGYYRDPDATRGAFLPDGWFDTGDYGFLSGGALALTGRAKEGIIVAGANYASAEIESVVETVEGVAVSFVAAAAVRGPGDDSEQLAVFFARRQGTPRPSADIIREIRETVLQRIGIDVGYVVPVLASDVPKTAIGKIQRRRLVQRFDAGEFTTAIHEADLAVAGHRTLPPWFARTAWVRNTRPRRMSDDPVVVHRASTVEDFLVFARDLAARGEAPATVLIVSGAEPAGTWRALSATLARELPWLDVRSLEVSDEEDVARLCARESELAPEPFVRWTGGLRRVLRLREAAREAPASGSPLSPGRFYVVAGGAGGVGQHVVRLLLARGACVLVLGRRPARDVGSGLDWSDARLLYREADITNGAAVRQALDEAAAHFEVPAGGAFMLAGVAAERSLAGETSASMADVIVVKEDGARVLATAIEERCASGGIFVAFSSVNALFGGAGAGAYSAANAALEAVTRDVRDRGVLRCWSLAWSMWDDVGMSRGYAFRDAAAARGFHVLRPADAVISLEAVLRRPPGDVLIGIDLDNPHMARLAVPASLVATRAIQRDAVAPRTGTERRIAAIWQGLLGLTSVGVHDHFVRLGGHSLKATQLVARLQREFGGGITLQDVFARPTIAGQAELVDGAVAGVVSIPALPEAPHYPVSHAQRRLWVLERMGVAGTAYTIASATRISGGLDQAALTSALDILATRHESLRTTFSEVDGEPRQVVHPHPLGRLELIDLRQDPDPLASANARVSADAAATFDLGAGPLLRARLLQVADADHVLLFAVHHIVCDGVSMDTLIAELFAAYEAAAANEAPRLAPLAIQYRDFASWQNARLEKDGDDHRAFWMEALRDAPVLDLPADRPRPAVQSFAGGVVERTLPASMGRALRQLAGEAETTVFTAWLAVLQAFLRRYAGVEDVIVGTPVAGREHADLEGQIGFFVNMLPLRLRSAPGATGRDLMAGARQVVESALAHQSYPYDRLVEDLAIRRDMGRNPLFDAALTVREHAAGPPPPAGLRLAPFALDGGASKFDATFLLDEHADGSWNLAIEFAADLFDRDRIVRLAAAFDLLCGELAARADVPVDDLELLPEDERRLLLEVYPFEPSACPAGRAVHELFDEQATLHPQAPAAMAGDAVLTYEGLRTRGNGLARQLLAAGVEGGAVVGILCAPSVHCAVAMLGILKAGATYLPLSPAFPAERIALMLDDAGCRAVVVDGTTVATATATLAGRTFVRADQATPLPEAPEVPSAEAAYVMYTSGSTGRPKGAVIPHRAIVRLVRGANFLQLGPDDRVLQAGSLAFDASTFEIWGPLLNGGAVCFADRGELLEASALGAAITRHGVTAMFCTAGLFNQIVEADPLTFLGLRNLIVGGERLSMPHLRRLRRALPQVRLINGYGPTENTTFTACHVFDDLGSADAVLGRPISNTSVFVLDRRLRPVPIGVPGEICTGGDGLALGYLNDAALTAERFVPNPFVAGDRLYRTGDLGRWNAAGLLEFIGRSDDQLKIRGFRVEPGEIEAALRAIPGVEDALVRPRLTSAGTRELVGYVVADGIDPAGVRAALRATLPDYMVPAHILTLDAFPLNANGKVDRGRLPQPETVAPAVPPVAAASDAERALVEVLGTLLGRPGLSLASHYFELGGDSIRAIQLASRLRARGWTLKVRDVFDAPVLRDLAATLVRIDDRTTRARLADQPGPVPMTPVQRWFFDTHAGDLRHFNQAILLEPARPLAGSVLRQALRALVDRHDALRLVFPRKDGRREAVITPQGGEVALEVIDLRGAADPPSAMLAAMDERHAAFDLDRGPLFRAVLFELRDRQRLWLAAHHLVVDGVSWRIIAGELEARLAGTGPGQEAGATFRARAEELARARGDDTLANPWPLPEGPALDGGTYADAETVSVSLSADLTGALLGDAHRAYGTSGSELLLAALGPAWRETFGDLAPVVAVEGHGRERLTDDLDLTETVGWFTTIYPVALSGGPVRSSIRDTAEALRRVPRGGLLCALPATRMAAPLSFNHLGQFDAGGDVAPVLRFAAESPGRAMGAVTRAHLVDVTTLASGGRLHVSVTAPPSMRERTARLLTAYVERLEAVAAHCRNREPEKLPSAFTRPMDLPGFDRLLDAHGWPAPAIEDAGPLTPMQASLLAVSLLETDAPAYCVQMAYTLRGGLERPAFERAWESVIAQHPMLRSAFVHHDVERPIRVTFRRRPAITSWYDLRPLAPHARAEEIARLRAADLRRGFDFEKDPLLRFSVFRTNDDEWQVLWTYHHVILDGWSLGIVFRDFAAAYADAIAGAVPSPQPGADPVALARWIEASDRQASRAWWRARLDGLADVTRLPEERTGAAPDPRELVFEVDAAATERLRERTATGVTLASYVQAAWSAVLSRYTGLEDVVFGTIVSGRPAAVPDADRMVGAFINAIPVRVTIRRDDSADVLARRLQADAIAADPHGYLPLAEVQELSPLGRDLVTHLVVVENYPVAERVAEAGAASDIVIEGLEAHDRTHYAFTLNVVPGARIRLKLQFDAGVHPPSLVGQLGADLVAAIRFFAEHPDGTAFDLPLPSTSRTASLLELQPAGTRLPHESVTELFARQAEGSPGAIAVVAAGRRLSYRETAMLAATVRQRLFEAGVRRGERVAVLLDRRLELPAIFLGILEAGAAYVPMDASYPDARIRLMLDDCGARVVITTSPLLRQHAPQAATVWTLDDVAMGVLPVEHRRRNDGEAAAYVIYTSGSTGRPKGVILPHAALSNQVQWLVRTFGIAPGDRMLQKTPIAFDASVWEFFAPLAAGASIAIAPPQAHRDPFELAAAVASSAATLLQLVPSQLAMLREAGWSARDTKLRALFLGGEALDTSMVAALPLPSGARVVNLYGPTEACINATAWEWDGRASGPAPIGTPVANTRVFVLDARQRPVPRGVPGELCIAGRQLAAGYLDRPDLTAERFVPVAALGTRVYRTGDAGRWLQRAPELEFRGRLDGQLKIRGHRVETGEVESVIRDVLHVRDACVVARDPGSGAELVAFVVAGDEGPPADWRAALGAHLPQAAVPVACVAIEALPLTPAGKVDRRQLEARAGGVETVPAAGAGRPPATPPEIVLADIWETVLGHRPSATDNFFDAGGHSLKAMQVASRAARALGVQVTIRDLFDHPTIESLAAAVAGRDAASADVIPVAPRQDDYALSHAQRRLWLLHQLPGGETAYNMPFAFVIEGAPLDVPAMQRAFDRLVARHEALRTAFTVIDGEPRQRILADVAMPLRVLDLSAAADAEAQARRLAELEAHTPFALDAPPLLRVTIVRMPGGATTLLLLTMHHIVGDGWSSEVLSREIAALYAAALDGAEAGLPPLRIHYKDFSEWQNGRGFDADEAWWLDKMASVPDGIDLAYDVMPAPAGPERRQFAGAIVEAHLPPETAAALRDLASSRGITVSHTVLSVFVLTLYRLTGQTDLPVGVSVASRNHPDLEPLIGFFVNLVPVRVRLSEDMDLDALLAHVSAEATAALERQEYPFDRLVQRLNPGRVATRQPLVNVVYAFQNFAGLNVTDAAPAGSTNLSVRRFDVEFRTSKFDLTLFVAEEDGLKLTLEYDTGRFTAATAERAMNTLLRFLHMAAAGGQGR